MSIQTKSLLIFGTGLSSIKSFEGLLDCCQAAVESGITWFDTAPSYKTEEVLGNVINEIIRQKRVEREDVLVQTKIDPIQMYEGKIQEHVENTLRKMRLDYLDALLIHWPIYKYTRKTWDEMQQVKEKGLVKQTGICNLRVKHLMELKSIGIVPEILQIERHPLNTFMSEVNFCKENGILLQDYSPLCKMHPIIKENIKLREIADRHQCGIGEIILCWHIQTGALPIFTSTKPTRINTYAKLTDIVLSAEELNVVEGMNINHKLYLESLICPGF